MVAKGEMEQTALARRHGSEGERNPSALDFFRRHVGRHLQLILAGCTVAFAVEYHAIMLFGVKVESFMGDKFQRTKQLSPTFQDQITVRAGKFNQYFRGSHGKTCAGRRIHGDSIFQFEAA
jgi:hypothetical protein